MYNVNFNFIIYSDIYSVIYCVIYSVIYSDIYRVRSIIIISFFVFFKDYLKSIYCNDIKCIFIFVKLFY